MYEGTLRHDTISVRSHFGIGTVYLYKNVKHLNKYVKICGYNIEVENAVDRVLKEMPDSFGIKTFLVTNREEVCMSVLTEYDEAQTMAYFKEEGREEGEERHLIKQICRKLQKGKSAEQIAEDLDEDEVRIQVICDVAADFAPDYDIDRVFGAVFAKKRAEV